MHFMTQKHLHAHAHQSYTFWLVEGWTRDPLVFVWQRNCAHDTHANADVGDTPNIKRTFQMRTKERNSIEFTPNSVTVSAMAINTDKSRAVVRLCVVTAIPLIQMWHFSRAPSSRMLIIAVKCCRVCRYNCGMFVLGIVFAKMWKMKANKNRRWNSFVRYVRYSVQYMSVYAMLQDNTLAFVVCAAKFRC